MRIQELTALTPHSASLGWRHDGTDPQSNIGAMCLPLQKGSDSILGSWWTPEPSWGVSSESPLRLARSSQS